MLENVIRSTCERVRGVFYGWWIVGIAAGMFTLLSITIFHGLGTLLVVFERHFFRVGHPCQELYHLR